MDQARTGPQRNVFELVGTVAKIERGGRDPQRPIANLTVDVPNEIEGKSNQFRVAYFGEAAKEVLASQREGQLSQVTGYVAYSKTENRATLSGTEVGDAPNGVTSRNWVHIVGNLGHDPQLVPAREGKTEDRVHCALSTGSDRWVELQSWGDVAHKFGAEAKRGDELAVDGRLRNHSFEKDGKRVWETQVVIADYTIERVKELPREYAGVALADATVTPFGQNGGERTTFPFEIHEDQAKRQINVVSFDHSVAALAAQIKSGQPLEISGNEKSHLFNGKEQIELRALSAQVLERAVERSGAEELAAAPKFALPDGAHVYTRDQIPMAAIVKAEGLGEDGRFYGELSPNLYLALDPQTINGELPAPGATARFELVDGREAISDPARSQEQAREQELQEEVALSR